MPSKYLTKQNLITAGVIIIIIVGFFGYRWLNSSQRMDRQVLLRLGDNQERLKQYEDVTLKIKKNEETKNKDTASLVSLALAWKGLGEVTKDDYFFNQALKVYKRGISLFGKENIIFYWGAGSIASSMEDFNLAEKYFKRAIALAPGYTENYIYLADLYRFKMKKLPDEIVKVYNDGIKVTDGSLQLILDKSSYLRSVGRYEESLEGYKILLNQYPENNGFKEVIQEVEEKINGTEKPAQD